MYVVQTIDFGALYKEPPVLRLA